MGKDLVRMTRASLDEYQAKRDFGSTPEPSQGGSPASGEPRFVVQEHHARSLHWDFRLERDGVLVSWALPKGVPTDPSTNHLAVPTEDHPLSYIDFSGRIPAGEYGAGTVSIWDAGTYECGKWDEHEVAVTLHGTRARGRYVLFRTGERRWMIHRMDPPEDPTREAMPERVEPMLATGVRQLPPDDERWHHEVKWDGVRAIAYVSGGRVRLQGRDGSDFTAQYPELKALGEQLASHELVLDGELVAFDECGRSDFGLLQKRMHAKTRVRTRMQSAPVVYMIFDLLHIDGHSTTGLPYRERRRLLDRLGLAGPSWQTPASHVGDGTALLEASRLQGLEGLVAKRAESTYEPGKRSRSWLKVKNVLRQELVVGGWIPGEGRRSSSLGSLLVGYYGGGSLRYAGRVGSGISERELSELAELLGPTVVDRSPFVPPPALPDQVRRRAVFVEPEMVIEVAFSEWTRTGTLRAPAYKGRRPDKRASDVVREPGPAAGGR